MFSGPPIHYNPPCLPYSYPIRNSHYSEMGSCKPKSFKTGCAPEIKNENKKEEPSTSQIINKTETNKMKYACDINKKVDSEINLSTPGQSLNTFKKFNVSLSSNDSVLDATSKDFDHFDKEDETGEVLGVDLSDEFESEQDSLESALDRMNIAVPYQVQLNLKKLVENSKDGIYCTKLPDLYK